MYGVDTVAGERGAGCGEAGGGQAPGYADDAIATLDSSEWIPSGVAALQAKRRSGMREHYDIAVIGSGPGGEGAAMTAAKGGRRVAVIDADAEVGGSCTHRGKIGRAHV